ncbi:MAG: class I SAM-dependent methyltransferase [Salinarimonas sp.]
MLNTLQKRSRRAARGDDQKFDDEARFLRSWLEKPLMTGAVAPSGKALARTMASYVDPTAQGPVIELGPGTGPVTEALINRGIEQERLVLVEFNPDFCKLLTKRFPRATIVQGDAYALDETLSGILDTQACAVVSSLPLFTRPMVDRTALLQRAQALMLPQAPFIQFTYAVIPPIPKRPGAFTMAGSSRVWRNIPPARVWVYRGV